VLSPRGGERNSFNAVTFTSNTSTTAPSVHLCTLGYDMRTALEGVEE
jgi:hypothetical protein